MSRHLARFGLPRRTAQIPALVALATVVLLAGCTDVSSGRTGTGNMVDATLADQPDADSVHWFTGSLSVEPAGSGKACLLLKTPVDTYVVRSAASGLSVVAWQTHGTFDPALSGIARDGQVVVPFTDRVSVRGDVVGASDVVCGKHRTLGITDANRRDPVPR